MTSLELITPLQLITPSVDVEFDPWLAQATHRDDVEAYYCLQPPREHVCMVTARRHSIEIDVNYTRLFPPPSPIAPALSNWIQREWKLDASKLAADPRNVLLLARDIERAYHQRRLTFEYDPFRRVLQLIVCDPTLLHEVAAPGVTDRLGITTKTFDRLLFADINHCIVQLPQDRFPYRRILQSHAARSWKTFGPEPPSSFSPRFASLIPHTKSSTPMLARHLTKFTATLKTPVASYLGNEEDAKDTGTIKEEKEYARRLPKMWMQPDHDAYVWFWCHGRWNHAQCKLDTRTDQMHVRAISGSYFTDYAIDKDPEEDWARIKSAYPNSADTEKKVADVPKRQS